MNASYPPPSEFKSPDKFSASSRFWVEEAFLQSFIKYLNDNKVYVQPPQELLESGSGKLFELEVTSNIPPERGMELSENFNSEQGST